MHNSAISRIVALALLLIAALIPVPYGIYQLLRIITCGVAAVLSYQAFEKDIKAIAWGALALAIIFNPFLSLFFSKAQWRVLDVIGALLLAYTLLPKYRKIF